MKEVKVKCPVCGKELVVYQEIHSGRPQIPPHATQLNSKHPDLKNGMCMGAGAVGRLVTKKIV